MNIAEIKKRARGHEFEICRRLNIPVKESASDKEHHQQSPFSVGATDDGFRFHPDNGRFIDRKLDWSGDIIDLVEKYCGIDNHEAAKKIADVLNIETVKTGKPRQGKKKTASTSSESAIPEKIEIPAFQKSATFVESDFSEFLEHKRGISFESLKRSGAVPRKSFGNSGKTVFNPDRPYGFVVLPIYRYNDEGTKIELCGEAAYRMDGGQFELKDGSTCKIKIKPSSKGGIAGHDAADNLITKKQVKIIFVTAGISDYLSLSGKIYETNSENDYYCFTNSNGESENLKKYRNLLEPAVTGQHVAVIRDNDDAGRKAAEKRADTLTGMGALTRIIELPDEKKGQPVKDTRDFFNAGGTFNELLQLFESAPVNKKETKTKGHVIDTVIPKVFDQIFRDFLDKIEPIKWDFGNIESVQENFFIGDIVSHLLRTANENNMPLGVFDGVPYSFSGTHWNKVSKDIFEAFLTNVAVRCGVPKKTATWFAFTEKLAKQFYKIGVEKFDENTAAFINLKNGTLFFDKNGEKLNRHNPADFIRYVLPFEYDRKADCPKWKQHLDRVLPSKEKQDYLAACLSLPFAKHLKIEKVIMFYGSGANGKSVCLDVYSALVGRENMTAETLEKLTRPDHLGDYARARIDGKLVNIATDASPNIADTGFFKTLASGEPVSCRLPYGNPYETASYAKLFFAMNGLPRSEKSNAFFRRLAIIEFSETIPENEQNNNLAQQIIDTELSGVLNWILDAGLQPLLKRGKLPDVSEIKKTMDEYRSDSDPVLQWAIEHQMIPGNLKSIPLQEAYNKFKEFSKENGNRDIGKKTFSKRLQVCGFRVEKYCGKDMTIFYSTGSYFENTIAENADAENCRKSENTIFGGFSADFRHTQTLENKEVTSFAENPENYSENIFDGPAKIRLQRLTKVED